MTSNDITIRDLSKVGTEDAEYMVSLIGTIPNFPKQGILFRDFIPVINDARP